MPSKLIDTIGCFYKHNINFNIYFLVTIHFPVLWKIVFRLNPICILPSSVSRVHGVFSSGGSLLGSGRQERAIAVACIVLGSLGFLWPELQRRCLVLGLFFDSLWHNFSETVCRLSFCLCVHIHLHLLRAILGKYSMILYSYFKHSSPPSLPHSRP